MHHPASPTPPFAAIAPKRLRWPVLIAIAIAAITYQASLWPVVMIDIANDYIPWFNHIVRAGPIAAFSAPFGSYSPPYLYALALMLPLKGWVADAAIIKTLSMIGNASLALAMWHLFKRLPVATPARFALVVMALPSIALNAALLGQCDAMYVAPLVMALAAALDGRHRAMLLWCGLALAIKAQALLFAPFVLGLLIARRVPFRDWLLAPIGFLAPMLPAWAAGWPIADLLTIYLRQADTFHKVALNAPNIWGILSVLGGGDLPIDGLAIASAVGAIAAYVAWLAASARHLDTSMLLRAATLAPLIGAGLLPRMHERYFILADVLSVALAMTLRARPSWTIAALVQAGSTLAVLAYASGNGSLAAAGGAAMIGATWITARPLFSRAANDNPMLPRPA